MRVQFGQKRLIIGNSKEQVNKRSGTYDTGYNIVSAAQQENDKHSLFPEEGDNFVGRVLTGRDARRVWAFFGIPIPKSKNPQTTGQILEKKLIALFGGDKELAYRNLEGAIFQQWRMLAPVEKQKIKKEYI